MATQLGTDPAQPGRFHAHISDVEQWRPRGIKVRGRAVIEDDDGRLRIRITPEVVWSWGLNADQEKRFASIEPRNVA